jgi:hypothetical protein
MYLIEIRYKKGSSKFFFFLKVNEDDLEEFQKAIPNLNYVPVNPLAKKTGSAVTLPEIENKEKMVNRK